MLWRTQNPLSTSIPLDVAANGAFEAARRLFHPKGAELLIGHGVELAGLSSAAEIARREELASLGDIVEKQRVKNVGVDFFSVICELACFRHK